MYDIIYSSLCENRKSLKEKYGYASGLHAHHIIPKHMGGGDLQENLTYLNIREHIIAHFLLWKIYKNPNDLRSMHMLGAKLSTKQRIITGKFCHKNKIGFHSDKYKNNKESIRASARKAAVTQSKNKVGTFDPVFRKNMCSKGGTAGSKTQRENKIGAFFDPDVKKIICAKGGRALTGFICVTNGKHRTRIKPDL